MYTHTPDTPPPIQVEAEQKRRLRRLATAALPHQPEVAEELLAELDRAATADHVPRDVVKVGSTVAFETDAGARHKMELVYPPEADILAGRISVLTPIGTALIGLSAGQSMSFTDRDGNRRHLKVSWVASPAAADDPAQGGG